jgi:monofunctional biosynthetic peptidoglycan transglycosylase
VSHDRTSDPSIPDAAVGAVSMDLTPPGSSGKAWRALARAGRPSGPADTNPSSATGRLGPRLLVIVLIVALCLLLLPYLITPVYLFVRPVSTPMLWRWMTGARVERIWVPIESVARALPRAVIAAEDAHFCGHHGVDLGEIREAIAEARDGAALRGGSTITQQTAKNLFLWSGRSFVRKALELPLALWIDLVLPKQRILEIYLNVAEWGPNGEFGAEAGARRAFAKSARDVTVAEAALMAAMLPNPARRNGKHPGPGLRRLGLLYETRARAAVALDACVRAR